jgi:hypothetical protein
MERSERPSTPSAVLIVLAVCLAGVEVVVRELVLPVLALAMASTGMTWGAYGGGRGEAAGCCAASIHSPGIPLPSHVVMGPPAAAQGGALVLGLGVVEEETRGGDRGADGALERKTVKELRELARLCGMRELARKGRRADLLEALEA